MTSMRPHRKPQLDLQLDAAIPDAASRWHEGASIAWLGGALRLLLSSVHAETVREGDALHLPLPPQATPRQIQDRAEAWLRTEAVRRLTRLVNEKSALARRRAPRLTLSFAARGNWVETPDAATLRCHWRLIEQPAAVIDAAISRALTTLPRDASGSNLFVIPHN